MVRPTVTEDNFLALLREAVPETVPVIDEHIADVDGDLLLHLLMSDLLRFATATYASGEAGVSDRLLQFVGSALDDGDKRVKNAVQVSFVENVGPEPGESPEFIATWPKSLLEERERQLNWRP
jgi:hypothetical protein